MEYFQRCVHVICCLLMGYVIGCSYSVYIKDDIEGGVASECVRRVYSEVVLESVWIPSRVRRSASSN